MLREEESATVIYINPSAPASPSLVPTGTRLTDKLLYHSEKSPPAPQFMRLAQQHKNRNNQQSVGETSLISLEAG